MLGMAVLTKQKPFTRIGINSTPTARTGSPSSWLYVPTDLGGVAAAGTVEAEEVELERNALGMTHLVQTTRNAGKGRLGMPLYPENVGTLLGLAINDNGSGTGPSYFTTEQYFGVDMGAGFDAGTDTGKGLNGMIADGFSFAFDRKQLGLLRLGLDVFVNQDVDLESPAPSPTWPAQTPYIGKRVLADLVFADNTNALGSFTGDFADLRSLSLTYANQMETDLHRADVATATLDGTWTQIYAGAARLSIQAKLVSASAKYHDLHRLAAGLRKIKFRVAGYSENPSGSTTCTASLTAGASVTVAVAATTGFDVNDRVLLWQTTANKFAVAKVTTVNTGVSLVVDTLDVTMDGTSETIKVRNGAWEIQVPTAYIRSASPAALEGNVYTVDFTADAVVGPSASSVVTLKAYDDDNT